MPTEELVKRNYRKLYSLLSAREGKYIRNLNRYNNNGVRRENLWEPHVYPQAYVTPAQGAEGVQTQINGIKSCVDSLTSKISQANVRPFFSSISGGYDTNRVTTLIQQFFDIWLDEQHAYPKSVLAFRDAAIFDIGVMGVNPESQSIYRVPPWEYFIDPAEYQAGAITQAMHMRKKFPLATLAERLDNPALKAMLDDDPQTQDEFITYWDLYHGKKWEFYDTKLVSDPIDIDYEQYGGLYRRPFVEIYFTKPLKGFFSTSLADDLYPIQRQVDELVRRMDAATRNAIIGMVFVNRDSGVKATNLENGWKAYSYTPAEGGKAVEVVTPAPMAGEWTSALEFYLNKMYEMAGISQLSAQAQKPSGLDSGKALDTMEDIESDRFNVQLQQFTHFLVDVSRVCIDTFPKSKPILPTKIGGERVTWGDARKERDAFSIQFSAASSLSKNPEEKRAEIQFLRDSGLIDNSQIADFYQMPDLEAAFDVTTASGKACDRIIDRCIKTGEVEYNETIDLEMLKKKTVKMINRMEADGDDEKYIDNLNALLIKVTKDQNIIAQYQSAPPPPPPPEPIREDALDAGQIGQLAQIAQLVTSGAISKGAAQAILSASYPKIDPNLISQICAAQMPQAPAAPQGAPSA